MRDGWVQTPIGDVAQVLSGFAFKSELFNKTEGIPLIRIRDLPKRDSTEALYSGSYEDRYVVKKGDFLIGMDGEFHCYEWNGPDALLNQRVCRIQDFKLAIVIPRYIYFAVNQYLDKIEQDTGYTTVKHISAKQVLGITIPLPPLPEQKRIVDLISSVDSYIEALQQQLESAKKSRNAVLHELLTAGGDDWVETTLGQISRCAGGCAFPDAFQGNKEGIPFIKVSDMNSQTNEKYIETSNNFVSTKVVDDLRLRIWDKGTVIFPKVGAALLTEKRRILTTKTIFDNNIMGLVPNERVLSEFLFLLMLQIRFSDHVQPGAVPSIKNSIVEAITVLLPSLSEQDRIVAIVSELDGFIHFTENSINRTKALRSGLLSHLLSGEHEIPASYDKVMGAA
jgi:type I restriction enzyme S subunit